MIRHWFGARNHRHRAKLANRAGVGQHNDVSPITHAVNWHLNVSEYNFGIQEDGSVDTLVKQVVSGGPVYRDGYLYLEDRPGIGCDIDEAAAEKYPFRRAYIPVCRSSDGSLTNW